MYTAPIEVGPCGADLMTIACPECGGPARIEWSTYSEGTPDFAEHIQIQCLEVHRPAVAQ